MGTAPYLRPNRLSDVISAIQFMAMNERSSLPCKQWAEGISGDTLKEGYWRMVFDEHTELFRKSPDNADHYALIWRRALPRLFFRPERRMLTQDEYKALPAEKKAWVSRPQVPEDQVKTLVDIAVALHAKQYEHDQRWQWWVTLLFNAAAAAIGAGIAILGLR